MEMEYNKNENILINESANTAEVYYKNMYIQILADFDNYRKRKESEIEKIKEIANIDIIKDLLLIVDDIETGIKLSGFYNEGFEKRKDDGLMILYKEIAELLTKYGIEKYCEVGDMFDPDLHEAVCMSNDKRVERGCISEIIKPGYRKGSNIIRYAKVKVEL